MRLPRPRWPQLSDSQVTTLVLAVGVAVCIVIAALRFGLVVALLTLNAVVAALILERTKLFRIGRRHDRELAEIRGWLDAFRDWAENDTNDLVWDPPTQPIDMPAPEGPVTVPADAVFVAGAAVGERVVARRLAEEFPHPVDSDDHKALQAAWVEETLAKFEFTGRGR